MSFAFDRLSDEVKKWFGWLKKEQGELSDYGKHKILVIISQIWVAQWVKKNALRSQSKPWQLPKHKYMY